MIGAMGTAPMLLAVPSSAAPPTSSTFHFTDLGRMHFGPDVQRIFTAGYATTGRFAAAYCLDRDQSAISATGQAMLAGLRRRMDSRARDMALDAIRQIERRFRAQSADGRWFVLDEAKPIAGHFGAAGDATYDAATGAFHGTDDTSAVQALVDWTLYWNHSTGSIAIGPGAYRTTRPIYVGRNTDYHSVVIEGDGAAFGPGFAGTRIFADHDLGPAIALSGILRGGCRNFAVFGRGMRWIESNALGQLNRKPRLDDLDIASWSDPAEPRQGERRYAPYAAIAIDPFRGDRPSDGYDTAADVPAWLGTADHYGNAFSSSELAIEKVAARGFNTAFVIQPCASDGNGDFIRFRDCSVNGCVHGWSVGNSQSRAVEVHACTANALHTVIDTAAHGARNGCLQGRITLLSVSNSINIFNFSNGLAVVGPTVFKNLYCEAVFRLGEVGAGSAADSALAFEDCQLGFQLIGPRGVPRFILGCAQNSGYGPGGSQGRIRFDRCRFVDFGPVLSLLVAARFTDTLIDPASPENDSAWRVRALRLTAGGLITAALALPATDADFRYSDPGGSATKSASDPTTIYGPGGDKPHVHSLDKASLSDVHYGSGEWRFTVADPALPIKPGAVLLDLTTGLTLFVRDVGMVEQSNKVIAVQQNDLMATGIPLATPFAPTHGIVVLAS